MASVELLRTTSVRQKHGCAIQAAVSQSNQGLICVAQRKPLDTRPDRQASCQFEKADAVCARQVGNRADRAFAPQELVRKRGYVAHVYAPADYCSPLSCRAQ